MNSQLGEYERVVQRALDRAPATSAIATGMTACVDDIYAMTQARVDALAAQSRAGAGLGPELARRVVERIRAGRGAELVTHWDRGHDWLVELLGQPDTRLIGGTAVQSGWALVTAGASAIVALRDRSALQVGVLDPRILVASGDRAVPVGTVEAAGDPLKWPHGILEFDAGVMLDDVRLPRSTRVMLRFSHEPLEVDDDFLRHCATSPDLNVALLSGLSTQPDLTTQDAAWAIELATTLVGRGAFVHHELSEFAQPSAMRAAMSALPVSSIGLSLSELGMATDRQGDPALLAVQLAEALQVDHVTVHADEWSMSITRDPSAGKRDALILGNAFASARARDGRPSAAPFVPDSAQFADSIPASGPLGRGWHAIAVPSPYQPHPRATVGLGDTFVAGLLLGESLNRL